MNAAGAPCASLSFDERAKEVKILSGARLASVEASRVEIALAGGFRLMLCFLDRHLARALIVPPDGLHTPRTWSLSPELAGMSASVRTLCQRGASPRRGRSQPAQSKVTAPQRCGVESNWKRKGSP